MQTRIIWGLLLGVLFLVLSLQSLPWVLFCFGVVHLMAQLEFSALLKDLRPALRYGHATLSTAAWLAISLCIADVLPAKLAMVVMILVMLGYVIQAVRSYEHGGDHQQYLFLLRALLLITVPLSFIPALVTRPGMLPYYILLLGASWGADTGAIFTGKSVGRTQLSPRLSPKKTVEGAVGGLLAAGFIWAFSYLIYAVPGHRPAGAEQWLWLVAMFVLGGGISLIGMYGDLVFSMYKRIEALKDYGTIIPGHGGFLDRFDSMLFVAPVVYMFSYVVK